MQGRREDNEEEQRRRQRQRQGDAPGAPGAPGAADYAAVGAAAATVLALGYGAYKVYNALTGEQVQKQNQNHTPRNQVSHHIGLPCHGGQTNNWFSGWFNPINALSSFWKKVEEIEYEERRAITAEVSPLPVFQPEAGFRHKYHKFDLWFQKLLSNVLRINNSERTEFVKAFEEIIKVLLKEMAEADPLFRYLFRTIAPAGSSWEELRICTPDEFDVNLILLPTDIQKDVKVEDVGGGHIAIRLYNGFDIPKNKVLKKFNNDHKFDAQYESLKAQLKNWMIEDSCVSRYKVINWLKGVVDKALFHLYVHQYQWTSIKSISRSESGPAVTINATMINGKSFSIDLVPTFEFSQEYLPTRTSAKLRNKGISRTWYAIPKGPYVASPKTMWRTSLYEAERDLMKGHNHLKPSIRIMKRLRDVQNWDIISSYYLKTMFMWMMDEQKHWKMSLGQIIMAALKSLEDALQRCQINYYWDDKLNLLENRGNKAFYTNVSGALRTIIKEFEKSVYDDTVNPMCFFGCDKDGNLLDGSPNNPRFHESLNNDAECVVM